MTFYTRLFLLSILLALTVSLFLGAGCDKLTTQVNNNTFYDSTLAEDCLRCHSDNNNLITVPKGQWVNSAHASADLIEALVVWDSVNYLTSTCGPRCHTGQGFIQWASTGTAGAQSKPGVIDCFTCHMPHTGPYGSWSLQTFRGDSLPVPLQDGTDFNIKHSNQCAVCHQAANYAAITSGTPGRVKLDSLGPNGPHSGADPEMLLGVSGYLFGLSQDSASHKSVNNSTFKGCIACHYGVGQGYDFGEHTFRLRDTITNVQYTANCNVAGCHTSPQILDFFNSPALDSIKTLTDSLAGRLVAINLIKNTGDLTHFYKDSIVPTDAARILYNYLLVKQDGSRGVHNARYSLNLLVASLGRLDSIPTADFTGPESTCVGNQVTFTPVLTGSVTQQLWDFGDGTTPGASPSHQYTKADSFTVTLTATGTAGSAIATHYVLVGAATIIPRPVAQPDSGKAPLIVTLTDTTAGTGFTRVWDFGDGSPVSNEVSVAHSYDTVGVFWAKLTLSNVCSTFADSVRITVTATAPKMKLPEASIR